MTSAYRTAHLRSGCAAQNAGSALGTTAERARRSVRAAVRDEVAAPTGIAGSRWPSVRRSCDEALTAAAGRASRAGEIPANQPFQLKRLAKPLRSCPEYLMPNAETCARDTGARPSVGPAGCATMLVRLTGSPDSTVTRSPE
jgi:hypothetical protein